MAVFVSSCSPDLWTPSGKPLVKSFIRNGGPGTLVFCHEGERGGDHDRVHYFDLREANEMSWLREDETLRHTPDYLGGFTHQCDCPGTVERLTGAEIRHATHRRGCYWQWMNRNATRWFRKAVSYLVGAQFACNAGERLLVWCDADGAFEAPVSDDRLREILGGKAIAYARGHRPAPETGCVIFDLGRYRRVNGLDFIFDLFEVYRSHRIWQYERWDDGALTGYLIDEEWAQHARDMVPPSPDRANNVLPRTAAWEFYHHDKGRHGRKRNIVR